MGSFRDHQFTLASSLGSSIRADVFDARARNYPSAIEAALFLDDVPLSVYDNLISTVRGRLSPLYRYFDLRKRVLGLQEIHQYDTFVPMVGDIQTAHGMGRGGGEDALRAYSARRRIPLMLGEGLRGGTMVRPL